ncbi:MAG: phasin family protein [Dongiaceae bacterium]
MAKAAPSSFDVEIVKMPDFSKFYTDFNKMAADFGKVFANGKAPMFDVEAAIAAQRKNVEALTAANQVAFQGVQAVIRRQAELVREAVEEFGKVSKEFSSVASVEDKFAKQAEFAKSSFESAMTNAREIGSMVQKASDEAVELLSKRVAANFDEVKTALTAKVNGKR